MSKYLVTYKIPGQFPEGDSESVLPQIIAYLNQGDVELLDFHSTHGDEFDNHEDSTDDVTENATIIEVRLDFIESDDEEENVDLFDGGESVYHYTLEALQTRVSYVAYHYSNGDAPLQKTVIGVEVSK